MHTKAFNEGYDAHDKQHRGISANPYKPGTDDHRDWAFGWQASRFQHLGE